jgi:hypothetical protein
VPGARSKDQGMMHLLFGSGEISFRSGVGFIVFVLFSYQKRLFWEK